MLIKSELIDLITNPAVTHHPVLVESSSSTHVSPKSVLILFFHHLRFPSGFSQRVLRLVSLSELHVMQPSLSSSQAFRKLEIVHRTTDCLVHFSNYLKLFCLDTLVCSRQKLVREVSKWSFSPNRPKTVRLIFCYLRFVVPNWIKVRVKAQLSPLLRFRAMKRCNRNGGKASVLLIRNIWTTLEWVVRFTVQLVMPYYHAGSWYSSEPREAVSIKFDSDALLLPYKSHLKACGTWMKAFRWVWEGDCSFLSCEWN
jgi:hypothetical protein